MAGRGRKSYTLEEKLEKVIKDIEEAEIHLDELKQQKIDLESQVRVKRLEEIDKMISESGKTFEEVKGLLFAQ